MQQEWVDSPLSSGAQFKLIAAVVAMKNASKFGKIIK